MKSVYLCTCMCMYSVNRLYIFVLLNYVDIYVVLGTVGYADSMRFELFKHTSVVLSSQLLEPG